MTEADVADEFQGSPARLRQELRELVRLRMWRTSSIAVAFLLVSTLMFSYVIVNRNTAVNLVAAVFGLCGILYFAKHLDFAGGRAARLERGLVAEAMTGYKLNSIEGAQVFRNVALSPTGPDVDFVVIHESRFVCIEVKARPTPKSFVRQAIKLYRTATHRAQRLRSLLAKKAQGGQLPNGIPSPHVLVVCRCITPVGLLPDGLVWLRDLEDAIRRFAPNMPAALELTLGHALGDMEEQT
jgi:hypothetical protein